MATLSSTMLTLYDWAKRQDPDGKTAYIAELLTQLNQINEDQVIKEGNLPTGTRIAQRTGLPDVYYRLLNQGVAKSKSTTVQVVENAAILEARSEIDKDEAELNGNVNEYRASESVAFLEAMAQKHAYTTFYGTAANPEEFVGLGPRYSDLSAANAQNILSAGGSGGDNTSIYFCGWGDNLYGVFPKGSMAGIEHEDLGLGDAFDGSNNRFRAYMDRYCLKQGLCVKDWRYVVRIPNIDVSDLVGVTGTQATSEATNVVMLMSRAIDRLPTLSGVRTAFYCNRTVASHLRVHAIRHSSSAVSIEPGLNQFGENIQQLMVLGHPVRIVDQLVNDEAVVS